MDRISNSDGVMAEKREALLEGDYEERKTKIQSHGFVASFKIIFRYLMADMKKKQRAFKIGFGTILIVVTFVTALESALQIIPLVFLKIAEDQVGEADLAMTSTKLLIYNPSNVDM